ncbi:hypothetical protein SAMN05443575_1436 [Jatrophihabitans endophyticus]|uniref:Uncharacterized protein n=1 Tax=Jatrophihabitans endophyticus TaxID=1206085 RepID=A0A1M5H9H6_9ACTN|nr:hypothetical protein [Jatrophihabitans endophyticus]SHG12402.1 hypothetical protein SAMN05443575_1436 [Jatrophihabitans endophyticus]
MPEMEYRTSDLRSGSAHAAAASEAADDAAAALDAAGGGSPFGDVDGAAALHGAVGHARDHHQVGARRVAHNADAAAQRASGTAALGDENTAETTRVAPRSERSAAVRDGM